MNADLQTRLDTFRRLWNDRVAGVDLWEEAVSKHSRFGIDQDVDEPDEKQPDEKEPDDEEPAKAAEEKKPDPIVVQFDMTVWDEHTVRGKLGSLFGDQGITFVPKP